MKSTLLLFICLTILLFGCNAHKSADATNPVPFQDTIFPEPEIKVDPRVAIEQIIFGRYCGECDGHCATMYRYSRKENQQTFYADYTDSYWKDSIYFGTALNDSLNFELGKEIIAAIPDSLLTTEKKKFGCPDCTDGCGLYLEISTKDKKQKLFIDFQTEQLAGEIKSFAEFLSIKLRKIVAKQKT